MNSFFLKHTMQEALFSGLITTLVQSRPLSFFEIYMVYFTVQNRSTLSALKRKRVDIDFGESYNGVTKVVHERYRFSHYLKRESEIDG